MTFFYRVNQTLAAACTERALQHTATSFTSQTEQNFVAIAAFLLLHRHFFLCSPPILSTPALIPLVSTAWRYLRGLTPVTTSSATPYSRDGEECIPQSTQMPHPISSTVKAKEINRSLSYRVRGCSPTCRLSLSCSAQVASQTQSIGRQRCSRHTETQHAAASPMVRPENVGQRNVSKAVQ